MFFALFEFLLMIIGNIFEIWTRFELVPGVNYLQFICVANILVVLSYIIFGTIKSDLKEEISSSVRSFYKKNDGLEKEKVRRKLK